MVRRSRFGEDERAVSLIHPRRLLLSKSGFSNVDDNHESPRKRRRISQVSTAKDTHAAWSAPLDTGNNGGNLRTDAVPTIADPFVIAIDKNNQGDASLCTSSDEAQPGRAADSPQTQDYNILFGPSPDFDASFHGQKPF